jgi:predicted aspartyl protease
MKSFSIKFLFAVLFLSQIAVFAQKAAPGLENLYQDRQYFELRDALAGSKNDKSSDVLFYRAVIANRFNQPERSIAFLQKFLKQKNAGKKKTVEAYQLLADNYTKTYRYGKAADAYQILLDKYKNDLSEGEAKSFKNVGGLWNALRNVAPQKVSVEKDTQISGTRDKARLLNIPVEINDQKMDFIFDTGANLSTMTASTANRLGLKIIEADVSVGSSTNISVKSKLAVAPELRIGNIFVRNAVFLVMEDKSLYVPQIDYQINAIIGFPIIKSLGEITLTRDDKISVSAKKRKNKAEPNMLLDGLLPLVAGNYKGKRMIFVFDTGANKSQLYAPFYEAEMEEIKKQSEPVKVKFGGAGGNQEITAHKLKNLNLEIGSKTAVFPEITVATENFNNQSRYYYGNLGQNLINQFERMTLDFDAMRLVFH